MPAATGATTRLTFLWEDNGFASAPADATPKTFGREPSLDTLEGANNATRLFEPGSREAHDIIEQSFDGSFTVSFTLSNYFWLRAVIANPSTVDNADGTYTHTYDGEFPDSIQITAAVENTDEERVLEGCIVTSATIDTSVPDVVTVNLDGAYANESVQPVSTAQVTPDQRAYQFAQARLDLGGVTQRYIQNASLTIENNTDIIQELGNRFGVDYSPKARNPSIDFTDIVNDTNASRVERMYGSATSPQQTVTNQQGITLEFTGANGNETITITLGGSFPDSYSIDGVGDPEADLEGELSEMAETVSATVDTTRSTT